VFLAVQRQHELDQGVFEARPLARREVEAAAGDLRAPVEIEDPERLAEIVVGGDRIGKLAAVVEPPPVDLDVVGLVVADGRVGMWGVREFEQGVLEFGLEFVGPRFEPVEFGLQLARSLDRRLGLLLLARPFQLADLARDLVALSPEVVSRRLEPAPLLVDLENAIEVGADPFVSSARRTSSGFSRTNCLDSICSRFDTAAESRIDRVWGPGGTRSSDDPSRHIARAEGFYSRVEKPPTWESETCTRSRRCRIATTSTSGCTGGRSTEPCTYTTPSIRR